MEKVICPKCGKRLNCYASTKGQTYYSHTYSLAHMFSDKPICDYSETVIGSYHVKKKETVKRKAARRRE